MSNKSVIIEGMSLEELNAKLLRVDSSSQQLDLLVDKIVQGYCSELDSFIGDIYSLVSNKSVDVSDIDIEYMIMQLPCLMYYASDKLENLGIREDVAKGVERETYNSALLTAEGRVSEKTSLASMASQKEALITSINSRAYRKVKARLEFAMETLGSLKKVIANRIANKELSQRTA